MAASAVLRRKSQLFLTSISPVTNTYDELVKEKLETGKFPTTMTGVIKIIGMLVLIFTLGFFLGQPTCKYTSSWYPYLFPSSLGASIAIQFVLFFIFSLGLTVKRPGLWIYTDVALNLAFSINTMICSVVTMKQCSEQGSLTKIPGPFGIAGGMILIISCGSIFLMYRYIDDEMELTPPPPESQKTKRSRSIFA
ncbi:uncharacterized protein LOC108915922 [Anoplophora glabripennis]|uniref:uncharacterized protein LOC108915922 n=1 Tax=Anoplophora glabripennis TaxID=217634 RepID=UPI000875733D|nr:uncharacterized protein LOC108915922 [Anoplophora glabripennis]